MKAASLEEVRGAVRGRWVARGEALVATGASTDSRTCREGELFFALRGERMDGHAFLAAAAARGCVAAVVALDAEVPAEAREAFPGGLIGVADTTRALGGLAAWHRRQLGATVVAVTGSNGKTTVKRMIDHVLKRRLKGTCSPKSFNNAVGVPLTLLGVCPGDDYVVCELGTNAPGEIAALAALAEPEVAVIASVAEAHIEGLGTIERVAVEKASILHCLAPDGLGVVWADSELLDRAAAGHGRRLVRFGLSPAADLRLTGFEPMGPRQRFQLNGRLWADLPLPGRHNAVNALAAIAVAQRFGLGQDEAAAALADFAGDPMRLGWIDLPGGTIINDAYNANPASLAAAVDVLADCTGRRRVLVAGDMCELGERAEQLHLQAGRDLAGRGIDLLASVGLLGRYVAKGAAEAGIESVSFDSVDQAAQAMVRLLREGDTVLVKGSRAVGMEAMIDPIRAVLADARPGGAGGGQGGPDR